MGISAVLESDKMLTSCGMRRGPGGGESQPLEQCQPFRFLNKLTFQASLASRSPSSLPKTD